MKAQFLASVLQIKKYCFSSTKYQGSGHSRTDGKLDKTGGYSDFFKLWFAFDLKKPAAPSRILGTGRRLLTHPDRE